MILVPKNSEGQELLDATGTNEWRIYRISRMRIGQDKSGPWWFMGPTTLAYPSKHSRWVHPFADNDFHVLGDHPPEDFINTF